MKTLGFILGCVFTSFIANAQENNSINIEVTIDNIVSNEGKVLLSLHTVDTFMKGAGIQQVQSSIVDGKVAFTLENVPAGEYAIMALHDLNSNMQMDFEANGMPKENYGMSGSDMRMGPPTFNNAKFEVTDQDLEFEIQF